MTDRKGIVEEPDPPIDLEEVLRHIPARDQDDVDMWAPSVEIFGLSGEEVKRYRGELYE